MEIEEIFFSIYDSVLKKNIDDHKKPAIIYGSMLANKNGRNKNKKIKVDWCGETIGWVKLGEWMCKREFRSWVS